MFKKLVITLLTATTIFSGISAYNTTKTAAEPVKAESRQNATEITSETQKLDYSQEQDYSYADSFIADVVDWNTDGEELALMTSDGYEFYAYKSANEYAFNKAYVALDDIVDVEKAKANMRDWLEREEK